MSSSITDIDNDEDAASSSLLLDDSPANSTKSVLFFWAEWHSPSNTGGPFDTVVKTLAKQSDADGREVRFYRVLAEAAPRLSGRHNVNTVPTLIFIDTDGTVVDRIDGGEDVASVTQCYSRLVNASSSSENRSQSAPETNNVAQPPQQTPQQALDARLRSLTTSSPIMLFMKGAPNAPRCGFSRQAIEILTAASLSFGYFDILEDDEVRQGLKAYSDWPTYPQLYAKGELVGGLDILKELAEEEGGIVEQLELGEFVVKSGSSSAAVDAAHSQPKEEKKEEASLDDKLKQLVNRHRVMLFMKGIPSSPRCGFSRQIVEMLDSFDVPYDAFNILEDEEVRQGLKKYSDWPTYPQLYVEGDLVGGLDIVKEMMESGDLGELLKNNGQD
mmetsp:Transcript_13273/g.28680  ORF Transcript_13273/g.28680 Transcript_13273/m.28680 type:complete len:386 (-) Transcript_13273:264-1421(-)|eukprot:CAMPEP_0172563658 /NCGR_PEP_ID=MMETSP1067-20121228/101446_1 /TAXON_ID=265564 ORGANISM="Thalassiosira punctigera, Strain Tpunct2005C2" /NCGR_SAMPLE_ID=MMETSP1067 /ASSEMBLY_ACC=CAM_ASM_000444 /LENGTH=385 /DNA_ID=CAMNT_0013354147 /DNA_START=7 /DNA_END=1164 /DNA_ORIENTATION=-